MVQDNVEGQHWGTEERGTMENSWDSSSAELELQDGGRSWFMVDLSFHATDFLMTSQKF